MVFFFAVTMASKELGFPIRLLQRCLILVATLRLFWSKGCHQKATNIFTTLIRKPVRNDSSTKMGKWTRTRAPRTTIYTSIYVGGKMSWRFIVSLLYTHGYWLRVTKKCLQKGVWLFHRRLSAFTCFNCFSQWGWHHENEIFCAIRLDPPIDYHNHMGGC